LIALLSEVAVPPSGFVMVKEVLFEPDAAATVSDVLLLNTTTIDARPLDVIVRPFWNCVPLTLNTTPVFFWTHA
jgi:hypothetical protein